MAKHYQIVKHGIEYPDYWQGAGTYGTGFEWISTGVGHTEKEAYDDAVEMIYQSYDAADRLKLPEHPKSIRSKPVPKRYGEEAQYYVSILYNFPEK